MVSLRPPSSQRLGKMSKRRKKMISLLRNLIWLWGTYNAKSKIETFPEGLNPKAKTKQKPCSPTLGFYALPMQNKHKEYTALLFMFGFSYWIIGGLLSITNTHNTHTHTHTISNIKYLVCIINIPWDGFSLIKQHYQDQYLACIPDLRKEL